MNFRNWWWVKKDVPVLKGLKHFPSDTSLIKIGRKFKFLNITANRYSGKTLNGI